MTQPGTDKDLETSVLEIVRQVAPRRIKGELTPDEIIGDAGLGFDSIARVELLAEIDINLGITVPVQIFTDPNLTVGGLIAQVRAHAAA